MNGLALCSNRYHSDFKSKCKKKCVYQLSHANQRYLCPGFNVIGSFTTPPSHISILLIIICSITVMSKAKCS